MPVGGGGGDCEGPVASSFRRGLLFDNRRDASAAGVALIMARGKYFGDRTEQTTSRNAPVKQVTQQIVRKVTVGRRCMPAAPCKTGDGQTRKQSCVATLASSCSKVTKRKIFCVVAAK